jgi:hypothetical protein
MDLITKVDIEFVLHDESINCYGFWLSTEGGDLSQFEKNPIMLFMHRRATWADSKEAILPLGHWVELRRADGKIYGKPYFDPDEFSQLIAQKVVSKTYKMASVGAQPLETSSEKKWLKPGQTRETVTKWKMKEASIVDIGGNDNALALYDEDDKLIQLSDGKEPPIQKLKVEQKNEQKMRKSFWALIGLTDNENEELGEEKVRNLVSENTALKSEKVTLSEKVTSLEGEIKTLKEADQKKKKEEGVALVDAAIKDGRIDAAQKEAYIQLFEVSPENAKTILLAAKPHTPVAGKLEEGKDKKEKEYAKLADMSWEQLDKGNKLVKLKAEYPELYAEKFEAKFGTKPNA